MGGTVEVKVGTICWADLTVARAERVRDFYEAVVGWTPSPVAMEGYDDYSMLAPGSDQSAAGICHAQGVNADLPPQWLIYIVVEDVERCAARCREMGGEVVAGPREMGGGQFCVIRDPAGAVCALYGPERPAAKS
jgi:predicted enzyme related to lactoylglutathione lyase